MYCTLHHYSPQHVCSGKYSCLCCSFISCFPGKLHMCFVNDFEMVPFNTIISANALVFTFHMRCIAKVRSSYFRIVSVSFLITFLWPVFATSLNIYVRIYMITDYDVRITIRDGSLGLHFVIP